MSLSKEAINWRASDNPKTTAEDLKQLGMEKESVPDFAVNAAWGWNL